MVNSFPVSAAIGAVLGFLSGLGVGGGSLLILWLTLMLGLEQSQARSINLLFFFFCAIPACLIRSRKTHIPLRTLLPAIVSGCLCAWAVSMISENLDLSILRKGFGILLLITGLRELFYRPNKE